MEQRKLLSQLKTTPETLNSRDEEGYTALHRAMLLSGITPEKVQYLIEIGAKINLQDNEGRTPLHHAVEERRLEEVKVLLGQKEIDVNVQDVLLRTPLHVGE